MTTVHAVTAALEAAGLVVGRPDTIPTISSVQDDSRRVDRGALFCAVRGRDADGHAFLADAEARGAVAVIAERPVATGVPLIRVSDSRRAASVAAAAWYGRPADVMRIVGVTGTNGKTTTVSLIRHLCNGDGSAGTIGTLGAMDGTGEALDGVGSLTTPGSVELQTVLARLRDRGTTFVAMEASSHALDQERLADVPLVAGVYTNLTHDHLDYHASLDAYFAAKARLSDCIRDGGVEVVNRDDPTWEQLPRSSRIRRVWYGTGDAAADVKASDMRAFADRTQFTLHVGGEALPSSVPIPGAFNVSNALAAAAAAWSVGLEPATIARRLAEAPPVSGRMEQVASGSFTIIRDYAHTPDALARALDALRPVTRGRLIVLFGAGGDRDKGKRPVMGKVAERADVVIVTSDNPRTEDPEQIIDDVVRGMAAPPHLRMADRREAIRQAVQMLRPNDCLLLAGKGHETYQVLGTTRIPFDEREIVDACLAATS